MTIINTIYDDCLQSISWYLQLQLIRSRWPTRKHLSTSIDEEPDTNPKPTFTELEPNTPKVIFHDFPDLENFHFKIHDFSDFSRICTNPAEPLSSKNTNRTRIRFFRVLCHFWLNRSKVYGGRKISHLSRYWGWGRLPAESNDWHAGSCEDPLRTPDRGPSRCVAATSRTPVYETCSTTNSRLMSNYRFRLQLATWKKV